MKRTAEKGTVVFSDYPTIPNLKKDVQLFPHQIEVLSNLANPDNLGMIDVAPGGGKTLTILCDILNHLNKGTILKPAWLLPGPTAKQQVDELAYWTGGNVNIVHISNEAYNNVGIEHIINAIRSAPINTIFLIDHSFMTQGGRRDTKIHKQYGLTFVPGGSKWHRYTGDNADLMPLNADGFYDYELEVKEIRDAWKAYVDTGSFRGTPVNDMSKEELKEFKVQKNWKANFIPAASGEVGKFKTYYWKAWALVHGGIDYVCLDESQVIKSGASSIFRACMVLARNTKMRRVATGTSVPNTPTDLFHQATFLQPGASNSENGLFGKLTDFTTTYGKTFSTRGGGVEEWNELAIPQIRKLIKDSGGSVVTRDRWRYMLPNRAIKFHKCTLHPEVQKEYDRLAEEELTKLLGNKNMAEAIEQFGEDDAALSEDLLRRLLILDMAIAAPELSEIPSLVQVAAKYPNAKVEIIDKLISQHFTKPDVGKVLIFATYKKVAHAVLARSKHASKMLYYDASNKKNLKRFREDPAIKVLVAVEHSIREGLNLQFVDRMIRINLPWTPGAVEQAWGRAFRTGSDFETVHQDVIICDKTLEVPKMKRLTYKSAVALTVVADYDMNPDLNLPRMTKETLLSGVDWDEDLQKYLDESLSIEVTEAKMGVVAKAKFGTDKYRVDSGSKLQGSSKKADQFRKNKKFSPPIEVPRSTNPALPTDKRVLAFLNAGSVATYLPDDSIVTVDTDTSETLVRVIRQGDRTYSFEWLDDGVQITNPAGKSNIVSPTEAEKLLSMMIKFQGFVEE